MAAAAARDNDDANLAYVEYDDDVVIARRIIAMVDERNSMTTGILTTRRLSNDRVLLFAIPQQASQGREWWGFRTAVHFRLILRKRGGTIA